MILIVRFDSRCMLATRGTQLNYQEVESLGYWPTRSMRIPPGTPPLRVEINHPKGPSDYFDAGSFYVVSRRLRDIIDQFTSKVDYLPAIVTRLGKPVSGEFFHIGLLDMVECFDYERSQYTQTEHGAREIVKLVLDERKAEGHHFFRVGPKSSGARPNPRGVGAIIECASEEFAIAVIESGIVGMAFTTQEHWWDFPPPMWRTDIKPKKK